MANSLVRRRLVEGWVLGTSESAAVEISPESKLR